MSNQVTVQENGDQDMVNGNNNVLFSKSSAENVVLKEDRVIRRAKRPSKGSPRKEEVNLFSGHSVAARRALSKNVRKSRAGRGRGLPKKGGAGGKGVWGKPGSEIYGSDFTDARDPNYDSDNQDGYVVERVDPEMTEEQIKETVETELMEYLEHGDSSDVMDFLVELNLGTKLHMIPILAINLALDRKAHHRELTSILLSDLYGNLLTQAEMATAFDKLVADLPDLTIDTPDAPTVVGQFLARAVADDCLPPKFVTSYKGRVTCEFARTALDKADILLSMKHGIVRLDNVWGVGGGNRPVKYLIKKMVLLLQEYLSSEDISEATRCLQQLEVPHFNHELVYEAVVMVIEDMGERVAKDIALLLKSLYDTTVITPDEMVKGFQRVYSTMPEICIDVPQAYSLLERFAVICHDFGFLSNGLYRELPSRYDSYRGRKRFVSEGDGGKIKNTLH